MRTLKNCWNLPHDVSSHGGIAATRRCRRRTSSPSRQHRLYLLPLPQGHGRFRAVRGGISAPTPFPEDSRSGSRSVRPILRLGPVPNRSPLLCPLPLGLFGLFPPPQRQQLCISCQNLGSRLLELAPLLHQRTDLFDPIVRNMFDPPL